MNLEDSDIEAVLQEWGHTSRAEANQVPCAVDYPVRTARARPLRTFSVIGASALGVLLLIAGVLAVTAGGSPGTSLAALEIHDGERVEAAGEVEVFTEGVVKLCDPFVFVEWSSADENSCNVGIRLTNFDVTRMSPRTVSVNMTSGLATVVGIYRNNAIDVTEQSRYREPWPSGPAKVPCPKPVGGWPHGATNANPNLSAAEAYRRANPGDIMDISVLRPSSTQSLVYVLAKRNIRRARSMLVHAYGDMVCVEKSRYSSADIAQAMRVIERVGESGTNYLMRTTRVVRTLGPDAQLSVQAQVPIVGKSLVRAALSQPPGLVWLVPWIAPAPDS